MATGTVPHLENYIKAGFNILISGLHGTGKTQSIKEACEKLGLKYKYYSASTLDPYTDLVGVPVPKADETGFDRLVMVRPREIDEAEVVVFDELNRADSKTRNAVLELVQFRAINGEVLPNLKCVIAAVNPPDGEYDVEDLDPALVDRFHVSIEVKPRVSGAYFKEKFGPEIGNALVSWWSGINQSKRGNYLSPRRLELIGQVWNATQSAEALKAAMPPGGVFEVKKLADALRDASLTPEERSKFEQEREKALEAAKLAEAQRIANIANWTRQEITDVARRPDIIKALTENPTDVNLHTKIADVLATGISPANLFSTVYIDMLLALSESSLTSALGSWKAAKTSQGRNELSNLLYRIRTRGTKADDVRKKYGALGRALQGPNSANPVEAFIKRYNLP